MAGFTEESVYTIPITPFERSSLSMTQTITTNYETPQDDLAQSNTASDTPTTIATDSANIEQATPEASLETNSLDPCIGEADTIICQTTTLGIGEVIGNLIQFVFIVAVILALGFLVYGGIRWLTSGGNKENVATARGTIIAAIIGLIIVFLSYAILNLVLNFLIGTGISDLQIPSMIE